MLLQPYSPTPQSIFHTHPKQASDKRSVHQRTAIRISDDAVRQVPLVELVMPQQVRARDEPN
eukprot:3186080-Prymnesium_polylepis.1